MFTHAEDHNSLRAIEVQLDALEFLLSSLPECLLDELGVITMQLLSLATRVKKQELRTKAEELLLFVRDILTADLVLPHFIAASEDCTLGKDVVLGFL